MNEISNTSPLPPHNQPPLRPPESVLVTPVLEADQLIALHHGHAGVNARDSRTHPAHKFFPSRGTLFRYLLHILCSGRTEAPGRFDDEGNQCDGCSVLNEPTELVRFCTFPGPWQLCQRFGKTGGGCRVGRMGPRWPRRRQSGLLQCPAKHQRAHVLPCSPRSAPRQSPTHLGGFYG